MEEKDLLRAAVVGAIIGLVSLFLLSTLSTIPSASINELTLNDLEKTVKIDGIVTNVLAKESITIVEIAQHNKMQLVVFDTDIKLQAGDQIQAIGTVEEYNGNLELIADQITKK